MAKCGLMHLGASMAIALLLCTGVTGAERAKEASKPTVGRALDAAKAKPEGDGSLLWYDIRELGVEGRGWSETDTDAPFDRLPARAEGKVRPPVWSLSRHSAGLCVRFATDAPTIFARWTLRSERLAMAHMPATGVSGLDLYAKRDNGRWSWLATGRPTKFPTNRQKLVEGLPPGRREFLLYLPLYNGVTSVEIGIPPGNHLETLPRPVARRNPIVFYGTSITQGGCASRPGMVHTAILGRWLGRPVINMGFSGNGRMEREVGEFLAELDPSAYVIDCLPNMQGPAVAKNTEPLVRLLREAHPSTPILLVEDRTYSNTPFLAKSRRRHQGSRAALKKAFDNLSAAGVQNLYYLAGEDLLGDDGEGTVDGSHPTDLGFVRQAEAFRTALEPLLDADDRTR